MHLVPRVLNVVHLGGTPQRDRVPTISDISHKIIKTFTHYQLPLPFIQQIGSHLSYQSPLPFIQRIGSKSGLYHLCSIQPLPIVITIRPTTPPPIVLSHQLHKSHQKHSKMHKLHTAVKTASFKLPYSHQGNPSAMPA